jgi:hypothetical protein
MKAVNEKIKKYLDANAATIIGKVAKKKKSKIFDSHDFIFELIHSQDGEDEYISWLNGFETERFRTTNSQIGQYLAQKEKAGKLGIQKLTRNDSPNIKGNDSENQEWEYLS